MCVYTHIYTYIYIYKQWNHPILNLLDQAKVVLVADVIMSQYITLLELDCYLLIIPLGHIYVYIYSGTTLLWTY